MNCRLVGLLSIIIENVKSVNQIRFYDVANVSLFLTQNTYPACGEIIFPGNRKTTLIRIA